MVSMRLGKPISAPLTHTVPLLLVPLLLEKRSALKMCTCFVVSHHNHNKRVLVLICVFWTVKCSMFSTRAFKIRLKSQRKKAVWQSMLGMWSHQSVSACCPPRRQTGKRCLTSCACRSVPVAVRWRPLPANPRPFSSPEQRRSSVQAGGATL